jgi:hypothetical protein
VTLEHAPAQFSVAGQPNVARVVLRVSGGLDAVTAPQLSAELDARNSSRGLVIGLSELTFVDVASSSSSWRPGPGSRWETGSNERSQR